LIKNVIELGEEYVWRMRWNAGWTIWTIDFQGKKVMARGRIRWKLQICAKAWGRAGKKN